MKIEQRDINSIKPYENNPRNISPAVESVARSIKDYGFRNPVIVDRNGVIICGHTRYAAARSLGLSSVPVIEAGDLTDEQVKAFRMADNRVSERSTWDIDKVRQEIDALPDDMFTGFLWNEFQKMADECLDSLKTPRAKEPAEVFQYKVSFVGIDLAKAEKAAEEMRTVSGTKVKTNW